MNGTRTFQSPKDGDDIINQVAGNNDNSDAGVPKHLEPINNNSDTGVPGDSHNDGLLRMTVISSP